MVFFTYVFLCIENVSMHRNEKQKYSSSSEQSESL